MDQNADSDFETRHIQRKSLRNLGFMILGCLDSIAVPLFRKIVIWKKLNYGFNDFIIHKFIKALKTLKNIWPLWLGSQDLRFTRRLNNLLSRDQPTKPEQLPFDVGLLLNRLHT